MKHEVVAHTLIGCVSTHCRAHTIEYFNQRLKVNRKLRMNRSLVWGIFHTASLV